MEKKIEESVLGATSLEGLGFLVDPVGEKLVARDLRQLPSYVG